MIKIKIDNRDLYKYTERLKQLKKHDLPIAVRNTLNRAAKQTKVKNLPATMREKFVSRRPTFVKSQTGYEQVPFSEFKINKMESKAGFLDKTKASKQMELQEKGGAIPYRAVPTRFTRKVESEENRQIASRYYRKMKMLAEGKTKRRRNKKATNLFKTKSGIYEQMANSKIKPLFLLNRRVKIPKRPFIADSAEPARKNIEKWYKIEASKRLKKYK